MRWRHPERGVMPPDDFIPFAEQHGLIGSIGSFVLDEACRQLADWTDRGRLARAPSPWRSTSRAGAFGPRLPGRVAEVVAPSWHQPGAAVPGDHRDRAHWRVWATSKRRCRRCPSSACASPLMTSGPAIPRSHIFSG